MSSPRKKQLVQELITLIKAAEVGTIMARHYDYMLGLWRMGNMDKLLSTLLQRLSDEELDKLKVKLPILWEGARSIKEFPLFMLIKLMNNTYGAQSVVGMLRSLAEAESGMVPSIYETNASMLNLD